MRPLFSAIFACLFLCSAVPAAATDWQAVESHLRKAVASPGFIDAVLDQYQLQRSTRTAMRTHLNELYRSDEVIRALVREMRNAGIDKNEEVLNGNASAVGRRLGAELFQSWAIKGLARLPVADQRQFYAFTLEWMRVASADDCKQLLLANQQSALDNGLLEVKYYPQLGRGELNDYLALLRKAVFAELKDFPAAKKLTREQSEVADKAFEAHLEKLIRRGDATPDMLLAMGQLDSSPAPAACSAGKLLIHALLDMKGHAADLMMLKMVLAAQ